MNTKLHLSSTLVQLTKLKESHHKKIKLKPPRNKHKHSENFFLHFLKLTCFPHRQLLLVTPCLYSRNSTKSANTTNTRIMEKDTTTNICWSGKHLPLIWPPFLQHLQVLKHHVGHLQTERNGLIFPDIRETAGKTNKLFLYNTTPRRSACNLHQSKSQKCWRWSKWSFVQILSLHFLHTMQGPKTYGRVKGTY